MARFRQSALSSLGPRLLAAIGWGALLLAAVFFARAAAAQEAGQAPAEDYVERFERQIEMAMRTGEFVGLSVAVIDQGEITFIRSFGETAVGSDDAVTTDTVFRFASVSKGFSTSLVGQLAEEGRLSWQDPVTLYEPSFQLRTPNATSSVTLEMLASHQVGLPAHAYDNIIEAGRSLDTAVSMLPQVNLVCAPGECYQYQNVAFSLLEPAVETADGRPFDEAIQDRIFDRLGMDHASVGLEGLTGADSWAQGHARRRATAPWYSFTPNENYYRVAPAGGLNGSIEDLALWARAQMGYNPDVIAPTVRGELQHERVDTPQERSKMRWMRTRLRDADYALGWRVYDYSGERLVMHAGGVSGYRALVAFMPERDVGVVGLWNAGNSLGWRILPTFFDSYLGYDDTDWLGVEDLLAEYEAELAAAQGSP
ncbi:MAG: serine hydrolase domain-containing protein [Maricaulaceae bacterium]|jgi:beta-lactamase class C